MRKSREGKGTHDAWQTETTYHIHIHRSYANSYLQSADARSVQSPAKRLPKLHDPQARSRNLGKAYFEGLCSADKNTEEALFYLLSIKLSTIPSFLLNLIRKVKI